MLIISACFSINRKCDLKNEKICFHVLFNNVHHWNRYVLISPLLTTLSSLYHIDTSISGWMVSAYAIGYALFALVSGPISDGRDRKKVMVY